MLTDFDNVIKLSCKHFLYKREHFLYKFRIPSNINGEVFFAKIVWLKADKSSIIDV